MYYDNNLGLHASALQRGVRAEDAVLAATEYIASAQLDEDRKLRLGFDSEGRLVETVVLALIDGTQIVIHAMLARRKTLALLERTKS